MARAVDNALYVIDADDGMLAYSIIIRGSTTNRAMSCRPTGQLAAFDFQSCYPLHRGRKRRRDRRRQLRKGPVGAEVL